MLEKALISGVVHQREETVYRVDGRDAGAALRRAGRGERQRRHDRPDRARDRLLGAGRGPRRRGARARRARRAWEARDDLGKVSLVGAGMKSHPGVAAKTFATLAAARDRAGGRLDLADQDRLPRRERGRRPRGAGPPRGVRARLAGSRAPDAADARSASSARPAPSARSRRAAAPSAATTNVRLFASARSAGKRCRTARELASRRRRPEALAAGDLDLALFSVGTSASSRELVPHAVRGGAVCVDKSAAFRLADGDPARRPRGERRRARSSTTGSSRTRTAARSRSPAC